MTWSFSLTTTTARSSSIREASRALGRAGQGTKADQGVGDPGVVLPGEPGKKVVANPGPGPRGVGVAGVVAIGLAERREVGPDLLAADVQQRPHQHQAPGKPAPRRDACQAAQAGPADDPMEDRLGLVVAGVADGDGLRPAGAGDLGEPGVARPPGIGLEVAGPVRLPVSQVKRQPERGGQLGHQRRIRPRRIAPDPVIEMRHRKFQAEPGCQRDERPEQANRVAPPRNGDDPDRAQPARAPTRQCPFQPSQPRRRRDHVRSPRARSPGL